METSSVRCVRIGMGILGVRQTQKRSDVLTSCKYKTGGKRLTEAGEMGAEAETGGQASLCIVHCASNVVYW